MNCTFYFFNNVFDEMKLLISVYQCTFNSFKPINHCKLHKSRNLKVEILTANRNRLMNILRHQLYW